MVDLWSLSFFIYFICSIPPLFYLIALFQCGKLRLQRIFIDVLNTWVHTTVNFLLSSTTLYTVTRDEVSQVALWQKHRYLGNRHLSSSCYVKGGSNLCISCTMLWVFMKKTSLSDFLWRVAAWLSSMLAICNRVTDTDMEITSSSYQVLSSWEAGHRDKRGYLPGVILKQAKV